MSLCTYEFVTKDGEIKTKQFRMSKAPPLGTEILIAGEVCKRIISTDIELPTQDAQRKFGPKYPYKANSMARWRRNCEHTKTGVPIIESARHEREIMGQEGLTRD